MATRIIRGYRTISYVSAITLAGIPPLEFLAESYANAYEYIAELKGGRITTLPQSTLNRVRQRARIKLLAKWREWLLDPNQRRTGTGGEITRKIGQILEEWVSNRGKGLTFHVTQLITGHGCFSTYLRRIGREETEECWFCPHQHDSARHTLEECPNWDTHRNRLIDIMGPVLRTTTMIESLLIAERRDALVEFSESVMSSKERIERTRRGEQGAINDDA